MGRECFSLTQIQELSEILFIVQTLGQAWWHRPVIPGTPELRWNGHKFEACLGYRFSEMTQNKNIKSKYLPGTKR